MSPTTVSHVLSGKRPVSSETTRRVRRAMEELGYVPNAAAQSLASGRTRTLGLLVPDIANYFFAELARGIFDEAEAAGYSVILSNTDFDRERERRYLHELRGRAIDGLIYAAGAPLRRKTIEPVSHLVPLALVDEECPQVSAITVISDNVKGGRLVADHLRSFDHREVLVIAGPHELRSSIDRVIGFTEAMGPDASVRVVSGNFKELSGYEITRSELAGGGRPSAIFALNDMMALGAIRALRVADFRVPDDVSVVGYDDIAVAAAVTPGLTTVRQPVRALGTTVAATLLRRLSRPEAQPVSRIVLDVELVTRDSVGAPSSAAQQLTSAGRSTR